MSPLLSFTVVNGIEIGSLTRPLPEYDTIARKYTLLYWPRNQIEVYFNNDDLATDSATNPKFYSLIATRGTVENTDDQILNPTQVTYDAAADKAVLTFASDLDSLATGTGTAQ